MKLSKKTLVIFSILCCALVGGYFLLRATPFFALFSDPEKMRECVSRAGVWAPLVFFLLQVAQVIVSPIPGNVTTLVGGALFGFWRSFVISSLAVITGSVIAFILVRICGRPLAVRLVGKETVEKYLGTLSSRSRILLALMFLLPFFPDDALCLIAGLTAMSLPGFVLLTALTRPWGLLFSALVGSGALTMPLWGWAIIIAVCAGFFFAATKYGPALEEKLLSRFGKR